MSILTTGAHAPILQTQLPQIQQKVNACYGYSAISRITITQTAPDGFNDGQIQFGEEQVESTREFAPQVRAASEELSRDVEDASLRQALEALGMNVMARNDGQNEKAILDE